MSEYEFGCETCHKHLTVEDDYIVEVDVGVQCEGCWHNLLESFSSEVPEVFF